MEDNINTQSQSEREILNACISLMNNLYSEFLEYLDFRDIHWEEEEEVPCFSMSMMYIVRRLFLWHTNHCGGTATAEKCRQLGVDYGKMVRFFPPEEDV